MAVRPLSASSVIAAEELAEPGEFLGRQVGGAAVRVFEAGVGHAFDDVFVGPDLGDVHGHAVGAAQAQGPDAVGVRGREELLDVAVVDVGDPVAVELEGLPVTVVVAAVVCPAAWRGAVCRGHARRSNEPTRRSDASRRTGRNFFHIFLPRCPICGLGGCLSW